LPPGWAAVVHVFGMGLSRDPPCNFAFLPMSPNYKKHRFNNPHTSFRSFVRIRPPDGSRLVRGRKFFSTKVSPPFPGPLRSDPCHFRNLLYGHFVKPCLLMFFFNGRVASREDAPVAGLWPNTPTHGSELRVHQARKTDGVGPSVLARNGAAVCCGWRPPDYRLCWSRLVRSTSCIAPASKRRPDIPAPWQGRPDVGSARRRILPDHESPVAPRSWPSDPTKSGNSGSPYTNRVSGLFRAGVGLVSYTLNCFPGPNLYLSDPSVSTDLPPGGWRSSFSAARLGAGWVVPDDLLSAGRTLCQERR